MNLLDGPFFAPPLRNVASGVDYLGLRQANLVLMDEFLPGINNVTRHIRPFSILSWAVSTFIQEAERAGMKKISRQQFRSFLEKLEVLYVWSHQNAGKEGGIPGATQHCPYSNTKSVPLTFKAWNRNVSLMDAVNYGPALKTDAGLGFVVQVKPGIYSCTDRGKMLAETINKVLSRSKNEYNLLKSLREERATLKECKKLYHLWRIGTPTPDEARIFLKDYFSFDAVTNSSRYGERSAAIGLILFALSMARTGLEERALASLMLRRLPFKQCSAGAAFVLERKQALWRVLQLRQLQRYAFEALFYWVEQQVAFEGAHRSEDLLAAAKPDIEGRFGRLTTKVNAVLDSIVRPSGTKRHFIEMKHNEYGSVLFALWRELETAVREDIASIPAYALHALFWCLRAAEELRSINHYSAYLKEGGRDRVSLDSWCTMVRERGTMPLGSLFYMILERLVINQHFRVALRRNELDKPRLRLTFEEEGLVSIVPPEKIGIPPITRDRLACALSLLTDTGHVRLIGGRYRLTARGKTAVKALKAAQ